MKNALLLLRLFVIMLFFLTACKEKEDDPKPATRTELLTAKPWEVNKVLLNGLDFTNRPELSDFAGMTIKFEANGTYTMASPMASTTGKWAFASNETKLVLDAGTADEITWDIAELNENSAKFLTNTSLPGLGPLPVMLTLELVPA
jgi:hypothetical protein